MHDRRGIASSGQLLRRPVMVITSSCMRGYGKGTGTLVVVGKRALTVAQSRAGKETHHVHAVDGAGPRSCTLLSAEMPFPCDCATKPTCARIHLRTHAITHDQGLRFRF